MNQQQADFIAAGVPAAQACEKQTDVPACVSLAQCIIESSNDKGWGMSDLAQKANNYFGIKANQFELADHDYQEFPTHEYENGKRVLVMANFAQYANIAESFLAHGLLLTRAHYKPAMNCLPNVDKFCWALGPKLPGHPEGCAYSTAPDYHDKLMQIIRIYNLQQYNQPAPQLADQEV
jgi:flagellum-specific peptidoglycan hydrolase FlgJ